MSKDWRVYLVPPLGDNKSAAAEVSDRYSSLSQFNCCLLTIEVFHPPTTGLEPATWALNGPRTTIVLRRELISPMIGAISL